MWIPNICFHCWILNINPLTWQFLIRLTVVRSTNMLFFCNISRWPLTHFFLTAYLSQSKFINLCFCFLKIFFFCYFVVLRWTAESVRRPIYLQLISSSYMKSDRTPAIWLYYYQSDVMLSFVLQSNASLLNVFSLKNDSRLTNRDKLKSRLLDL